MSESPLSRYKRMPKLQIDLPSHGRFWKDDAIEKFTDLEVYSMTASDEISTKTPDTLFSGETTANIIKNCIPSIKNPWVMPILDINACLSAIRLASTGNNLEITTKCPNCKEENTYGIDLQQIIEYYTNKEWQDVVYVDNFVFELQPMSYKEYTEIQKNNFKIQRQIYQHILKMDDSDEKEELLKESYLNLARIRAGVVIGHVVSITVDGEIETNRKEIIDFINNSDKQIYKAIEEVVIRNTNNWNLPPSNVNCSNEECNHNWDLPIDLDYSNFFVKYSRQ